jgi:hypothetical protein
MGIAQDSVFCHNQDGISTTDGPRMNAEFQCLTIFDILKLVLSRVGLLWRCQIGCGTGKPHWKILQMLSRRVQSKAVD